MRTNPISRASGIAIAAGTVLTLLLGCSSGSDTESEPYSYGPTVEVGDGTARTYVEQGDDGAPAAIGVRFSATALDGLSDALEVHTLEFPAEADETAFDHLTMDWNPHGHEPVGLFDQPHFDIHFYMIGAEQISEIDPAAPGYADAAANMPEARYMPADYVPAGPPEMALVPQMGMHWVDGTLPIAPGQYDFTQILIEGSWDGEWTFIEPMLTRDWLLTRPTIDEPVKQPEAYQQSAYYPTTYSVSFDDQAQEYVVELGGLTMREES
ncbi:DUF5602 domain-containing protein [Rhodococcus aetherivorans]|uniref:DUF5602 domain-containing protein n=1 Tax=Rhodococcus aetherivorans TaxID=191292 RepID=A0AA46NXM5_9NOCA|nr:DUF5602 domain-containing protein [Rhodococcus aetherivorans]UYF93871.1 DUF5602 domain-containing protein [Rhodococcus aetherivorans]